MTRKNRNAAAGVLAFALSLLVAPAALAEPFEGEQPGPSTATVEPAPGWEQNKGYLEFLEREQQAAQSSTARQADTKRLQAQVEYQERLAAADSGETAQTSTAGQTDAKRLKAQVEYQERQQQAAQSSTAGSTEAQMPKAQVEYLERQAAAAAEATDDSGPGWLLGAGVITAVAIGSVVVAAIRSRRPETAEPAEREREKLTV
jgi:hypothetical protein